MKNKAHPPASAAKDSSPYHPDRVRFLVRAIKAQLEIQEGREIPFDELARYVGQSTSSVFDKVHRPQQPQIEALIGWLERIPETTRNQLLNSACRCFPSLDSSRIAHDPAQVSRLRTLLHQGAGLTVIQSGSETQRTFLATALGHTCRILEPERRPVCGIDSHKPDWFVPLPDVTYFDNLVDSSSVREAVKHTWTTIAEMKARLTIFNGVWPTLKAMVTDFGQFIQKRHVIITSDSRFRVEDIVQRPTSPVHVLTMTEDREHRYCVNVERL